MAIFQLWACCFHKEWGPRRRPRGAGCTLPCTSSTASRHTHCLAPCQACQVSAGKKKEKRKLSFYKAYKHSVRILCITGKMISQDITMTYFTS